MSRNGVAIRSADTSVPVSRSKVELENIVRRYGAVGFSTSENYETGVASVTFMLPDAPGSTARIPVKIPVETLRVFQAMYPKNSWGHKKTWTLAEARQSNNEKAWAQAERVAWRNLALWVTAALSAATLGLQTITEAFFAHTVVSEHGERMIEAVDRAQSQLGPGVRALLASPADAEITS